MFPLPKRAHLFSTFANRAPLSGESESFFPKPPPLPACVTNNYLLHIPALSPLIEFFFNLPAREAGSFVLHSRIHLQVPLWDPPFVRTPPPHLTFQKVLSCPLLCELTSFSSEFSAPLCLNRFTQGSPSSPVAELTLARTSSHYECPPHDPVRAGLFFSLQ